MNSTNKTEDAGESLSPYLHMLSPRALSALERLGIHTFKELAARPHQDFLNLRNCGPATLSVIQSILVQRDLSLATGVAKKRAGRLKRLEELVEQGRTRKEIAAALGISYNYVNIITRANKIETKSVEHLPKKMDYALASRLIRRGLPHNQLAAKLGVSCQRVGQYIHSSGLHGVWKTSRTHYLAAKNRKEEQKLEIISSFIRATQEKRYNEASWEEKKRLNM